MSFILILLGVCYSKSITKDNSGFLIQTNIPFL